MPYLTAHDLSRALATLTKVIDATYPDYERLTPDEDGPAVQAVAGEVIAALETVMACASEARGCRKVRVTREGGELLFFTRCEATGADGATAIDSAADEGCELDTVLFGAQTVAALKAFGKREAITFRLLASGFVHVASCVDATKTATLAPATDRAAAAIMPERSLDRPVVEFIKPERNPGSEAAAYSVTVTTHSNRPAIQRDFSFPSWYAASRAYVRHVEAARLHCDVTESGGEPGGWSVGLQGSTVGPEPGARVTLLTRDQEAAFNRRLEVIREAREVFGTTTESDMPWSRDMIADRDPDVRHRLPIVPAHGARTKALQAICDRALSRAPDASPKPRKAKGGPRPARNEVERAACLLGLYRGGRGKVAAWMQATGLLTYDAVAATVPGERYSVEGQEARANTRLRIVYLAKNGALLDEARPAPEAQPLACRVTIRHKASGAVAVLETDGSATFTLPDGSTVVETYGCDATRIADVERRFTALLAAPNVTASPVIRLTPRRVPSRFSGPSASAIAGSVLQGPWKPLQRPALAMGA